MLLTRSRITARNDGRSLPFDESHSSSSTYVDTHTFQPCNAHAATRVPPLCVHLSRVTSNAASLPRSGSMLDPLYSFETIRPLSLPLPHCTLVILGRYCVFHSHFPRHVTTRIIDRTSAFDERRPFKGHASPLRVRACVRAIRKHLCGGRASSGSKHRPFGDDLPTVRALARQIALPNRAS